MKNRMPRIVLVILLLTILTSPATLSPCAAQSEKLTADYDYRSLALNSISASAIEASKLADISQRVRLLIYAARILPPGQHDEAIRFFDASLRDLKQWESEDKASRQRRTTAATLRSEILAAYAAVDPEKATAIQKDLQPAAEQATGNSEPPSLKSDKWFAEFSNRRVIADQTATMALSFIETNPDKVVSLVLQSLQGGTISAVLFDIFQKLNDRRERALLGNLEIGIGQVLASSVTLDPSSLSYGSILIQSDKDMPPSVRSEFIGFFMRSLETWSELARAPGIDPFYVSTIFTRFSLNVRPVILQFAPDQLLMFDVALEQMAPLVPEATRSRLEAFQPEKVTDPRDRLNDILKDANSGRRDLRLVRLVSELLRKETADAQDNFELAADAIDAFSDAENKSAFSDLLAITRMNRLVKQQKFIEAQSVAGAISSDETRAWALLALATAAAKVNRVLGFELIAGALKALDKASPSPHKVELALLATAMFAKSDPERAFDTLSAASRYANSSAAKIDPPARPPVAFGLEARIGDARTKLGVFPERLAELQIDPSLSVLGTADWFRANEIADGIREPAIRLRLRLQFAEAILTQGSKPKRKERASSPPAEGKPAFTQR